MKTTLLTLLLAASFAAGEALAGGDPVAGKTKATPCAGCHGPDGNSANPEWPKLAGQHPQYIVKTLQDFKEGKSRNNAMMAPMAAGLSKEDMEDIAAYYASQPLRGGVTAEEFVELGEHLYRAGKPVDGMAACMSCHGPNGSGNPQGKIPSLRGQHATYTANQLKAFRSAARSNDPYETMRTVAKRMTDREIEAVSEYLAGLH